MQSIIKCDRCGSDLKELYKEKGKRVTLINCRCPKCKKMVQLMEK